MSDKTPPNGEARHTPGKWICVPQTSAGPMIAREYETGNQMRPTGLRLICHVLQRNSSLREDEANARLIAAAPSLLAACELLVDYYRGHEATDDQCAREAGTGVYEALVAARAAIASALPLSRAGGEA